MTTFRFEKRKKANGSVKDYIIIISITFSFAGKIHRQYTLTTVLLTANPAGSVLLLLKSYKISLDLTTIRRPWPLENTKKDCKYKTVFGQQTVFGGR